MRYAAYVRHSSTDQSRRSSLNTQQQAIKAWVASRNGQLVHVYKDAGHRGNSTVHPGLQQMLEDAKQGKFDAVVVHNFNRLGRRHTDVQAIQVGGPSGRMVGPGEFHRRICFDDLATGGSMVVFGEHRDLLHVVRAYQAFFAEESCGYCTPCRVGNELLLRYLDRLLAGRGEPRDLDEMRRIAGTMRTTSRCGLGQTACNPVLTTLESFPGLFEAAVDVDPDGYRRSFDLQEAVAAHRSLRGDTVVEDLPDWAD